MLPATRPGRHKLRDAQPPGMIHLPRIGLTPIDRIQLIKSDGMYSQVKLKREKSLHLVSEPLAYFKRLLPDFQIVLYRNRRQKKVRKKLINPIFIKSSPDNPHRPC
jgi:hypothetical protein